MEAKYINKKYGFTPKIAARNPIKNKSEITKCLGIKFFISKALLLLWVLLLL